MVPVVDVINAVAMAHTSSGEAHKLGMQISDGLRQVGTHTVLSMAEGIVWKEAHDIHMHLCVAGGNEA